MTTTVPDLTELGGPICKAEGLATNGVTVIQVGTESARGYFRGNSTQTGKQFG